MLRFNNLKGAHILFCLISLTSLLLYTPGSEGDSVGVAPAKVHSHPTGMDTVYELKIPQVGARILSSEEICTSLVDVLNKIDEGMDELLKNKLVTQQDFHTQLLGVMENTFLANSKEGQEALKQIRTLDGFKNHMQDYLKKTAVLFNEVDKNLPSPVSNKEGFITLVQSMQKNSTKVSTNSLSKDQAIDLKALMPIDTELNEHALNILNYLVQQDESAVKNLVGMILGAPEDRMKSCTAFMTARSNIQL